MGRDKKGLQPYHIILLPLIAVAVFYIISLFVK